MNFSLSGSVPLGATLTMTLNASQQGGTVVPATLAAPGAVVPPTPAAPVVPSSAVAPAPVVAAPPPTVEEQVHAAAKRLASGPATGVPTLPTFLVNAAGAPITGADRLVAVGMAGMSLECISSDGRRAMFRASPGPFPTQVIPRGIILVRDSDSALAPPVRGEWYAFGGGRVVALRHPLQQPPWQLRLVETIDLSMTRIPAPAAPAPAAVAAPAPPPPVVVPPTPPVVSAPALAVPMPPPPAVLPAQKKKKQNKSAVPPAAGNVRTRSASGGF
jgi:hypothetical protein